VGMAVEVNTGTGVRVAVEVADRVRVTVEEGVTVRGAVEVGVRVLVGVRVKVGRRVGVVLEVGGLAGASVCVAVRAPTSGVRVKTGLWVGRTVSVAAVPAVGNGEEVCMGSRVKVAFGEGGGAEVACSNGSPWADRVAVGIGASRTAPSVAMRTGRSAACGSLSRRISPRILASTTGKFSERGSTP